MTTNTIPALKNAEKVAASAVVAADGIRVPRATSGPVLDLDLLTMSEQLRYEGAWSDGRNSRTLVKHRDFRMILTVMRAGALLHRHHARGTVLIQVLSGHIRAHILNNALDVRTGHALSLDPHIEHEVEAVDESALLITIAWPPDLGIVRSKPAAAQVRRLASLSAIADRIETAVGAESDAA